jgi:hypothetical protein
MVLSLDRGHFGKKGREDVLLLVRKAREVVKGWQLHSLLVALYT